VLIDCGLFQGGREIEEENAGPFGFDPKRIDALLLTHAHLDHCGRVPLLVQRGFRGPIITTAPTRALARIVLMDSAGLQEEEARRAERHRRRAPPGQTRERARGPLYGMADAFHSMDCFGAAVDYGRPVQVAEGIRATFVNAGHILGSASIHLEIVDGGEQCSVFFSGDIGVAGRPLLDDPQPPPAPPDYVVMETTYGDRDHRPWAESVAELIEVVARTRERGGNVIIPTFALERAQEVLYALSEGIRSSRLPADLPVFLDSPMAISATAVFNRHAEALRAGFPPTLQELNPFELPGLRLTRETADSMAINEFRGGAVIMAGSGMATGGRVRHHLLHNLADPRASVVFVGYASPNTLARLVIDGAPSVRLFDEQVPVRAQVHTINGFSAHAGRTELLAWLARCGHPRCVFLVHGDAGRGMRVFREALQDAGVPCQIPAPDSGIALC
jgi:metallo-beta-lactamase family protein